MGAELQRVCEQNWYNITEASWIEANTRERAAQQRNVSEGLCWSGLL